MENRENLEKQSLYEWTELSTLNMNPLDMQDDLTSIVSDWLLLYQKNAAEQQEADVPAAKGYKNLTTRTRKHHISDLVDISLIHKLLYECHAITGVTNALLDNDNNILSAVGWLDICTKFHRVCPHSEKRCRESDSFIFSHIEDGDICYKCLNGLTDYAVPIIVEGQKLAAVYVGQFLHEPPDIEFFRQQAKECGFDEAAYMKALEQVPIIPEDRLQNIMNFYSQLVQVFATMGLERIRQLEAAEDKFTKAFKGIPIIMFITTFDEDGLFIDVNDYFCQVIGFNREEMLGKTSLQAGFWLDPNDRALVLSMIKKKQAARDMEIRFGTKSGEQRLGLFSAERIDIAGQACILNLLIDITERKQMEIEMNRLDRLNLVGEMAASIGHEIRNPMTTVRGFLQMLQGEENYLDDNETLELMIDELDRANAIITEFLSLAKHKLVKLEITDLNLIIKTMLPLFQVHAISQDKFVELELGHIPRLFLDEKEIRQMLLNLVRNGLEAMLPGGILTIRTAMKGEYIILSIEDQGEGIPPELLEKMGTPFFSTKEHGTGLGLAVCYGIAKRHNASIDIETGSQGTTFNVRFERRS